MTILALLSAPLMTAWVGLAGLLGMLVLSVRASRSLAPRSMYTLPFALYLGGALIGLCASVRPVTGSVRFFGILAALTAFLVASSLALDARRARRTVWLLLAVTAIATLVALMLAAPFVGLERIPEPLTAALNALEPARKIVLDEDDILQRYRLRASGLGTLGAFGIAVAAGPLFTTAQWRTRAVALAAMAFFAAMLLVAGNRGAMLSAVLVLLLLGASRNRWMLAGAVAIAAAALIMVSGVVRPAEGGRTDQMLGFLSGPSTDPGSVYRRVEFWENSLFLLGDFRFTGVGLGIRSVQETYETYFLPVDPRFSHAHNIFIQSYLEQGILGFAGIASLVLVGLIVGWRSLRVAREPDVRGLALSSGGAALSLIIAGLTEIVVMTTIGMTMLALSLGLLEASRRVQTLQRTPRVVRDVPDAVRVPAGVGAAAVVMTLLAGWLLPPPAAAQPAPPATSWPIPPAQADGVTILDDVDRSIVYLGPWIVREDPDASGRVRHLSAGSGAAARVRFSGEAISLYFRSGPDRSGFDALLDGQPLDPVDQRGPAGAQRLRWAGFPPGEHELLLRARGEHADVDGFTLNEPDVREDGDATLSYSGAWQPLRDAQMTGGTARRSDQANASIQTNFTGRSVSIYYSTDTDRGVLNVSIDGRPVDSIDQYGSRAPRRRKEYAGLAAGEHTISLTVTGLKNSASSGPTVDIDAIVIDERPGLILPEARTPAVATPVAVQAPRRAEAPRVQPLAALGASFYLNLGATNIARASIGVDRPREERERLLEDADRWLKEALDRDPGNLAVYRNAAASAAAASQGGRARRALQEGEALADPGDKRFYFQAGRIYRDIGDTDRAIAAWTRADAIPQMIQWGAALVRRGQWKNAAEVNLAAVRLSPSDPVPYRALASSTSRQQGDDAALAQMVELSMIYPDMPWPYLEAGDLLAKMNRATEARTSYARALAIAPADAVVQQRVAGR